MNKNPAAFLNFSKTVAVSFAVTVTFLGFFHFFPVSVADASDMSKNNLLKQIHLIYESDAREKNMAAKIENSRLLLNSLKKLEYFYLSPSDKIKKNIALQQEILDEWGQSVIVENLSDKQKIILYAIRLTLDELHRPQAAQTYPKPLINDVSNELLNAELAAGTSVDKIRLKKINMATYRYPEDARYYLKRALSKFKNKDDKKEKNDQNDDNQGENNDRANNGNGESDSSEKQKNTDDQSGNSDTQNADNSQRDNTQSDNAEENSDRQNVANNAAEEENARAEQMNKDEEAKKKYAEYKNQVMQDRMKRLGITEDQIKQFENPRLKVEKDW